MMRNSVCVGFVGFLLLGSGMAFAETSVAPSAVVGQAPAKTSQKIQDASEGMELMGVGLQLMQIPLAMLSGDNAKAQQATQTALTDVNKLLAKNPDSPAGLLMRGQINHLVKEGSGNADFERVVAVTTERMKAEPDYVQNYKVRAEAYEALGQKDAARSDLERALQLTNDPKEIKKIQKDLAKLEKRP